MPIAAELSFPDDLVEHDQWVLWRFEMRNGRQVKMPYQMNGNPADTTDARTWSPFEKVSSAWRARQGRYAGLGFVFSDVGLLTGIDLDDAIDEHGELKGWARGVVERFADTYMEISPGGRGLKIWARGRLPANLAGVKVGDGTIEMYDHARYFTVTGRVFHNAPLQVEDHAADLLSLYDHLTRGRRGWSLKSQPGGQIPYGRQHNTLVSLCGTLRARGICEAAIEVCLQVVNEKQCEKPGAREQITRIVRSSRRWAQSHGKAS